MRNLVFEVVTNSIFCLEDFFLSILAVGKSRIKDQHCDTNGHIDRAMFAILFQKSGTPLGIKIRCVFQVTVSSIMILSAALVYMVVPQYITNYY